MKISKFLLFGAVATCLSVCDRNAETYRDAHGDAACKAPRCSGHDAGWQWAKRRRLSDPKRSRGRSRSFTEGRRAFASAA